MRLLSWLIFFLVVVVEGTITSLPLTLIFLLCLTVMKRQEWIFFLAFLSGLILDAFSMRALGISSLFFVSFVFMTQLYQRKYETATMPFVVLASFFGSLWYLVIIGSHAVVLQSVFSSVICAVAFSVYKSARKTEINDGFRSI